jgi:hypothetical protein
LRRRATPLLEKLPPSEGLPMPPEQLRAVRGVDVLERIGTAEARESLEELAKGNPKSRLMQQAKETLERLAKRTTAP